MPLSLRELLEEAGVHPSELEEATGCHRVTVYKWIVGQKRPRGHRLRAIAGAIGCSVADVRDALDEIERRLTAGKRP